MKLILKPQLTNLTERKAQLRTVLWMRLFAVITLIGLLSLAHGMAAARLPWPTLLFVLALMLLLNILAWFRLRGGSVGPYEVGAQIFADLFGFSVLLYFTGGATNPFVMFYLPLLGLAAALLPWNQVVALAGFSILAYSVLMLEYIPLVLAKPQNAVELHLLGMWINFLVSVLILVGFVARLSNGIRQRDQDLNTAQTRLNRDARMAALGNQSASLAHELGTPLNTAKIILTDWMDSPDGLDVQVFQREAMVVREQLERMEQSLIQLRNSLELEGQVREGPNADESSSMPVEVKAWLDNWVSAWRNRNPETVVVLAVDIPASLKAAAQWDSMELVLNGVFENCLQAYERALTLGGAGKQGLQRCIHLSVRYIQTSLEFVVEDKAGGFDKDLLKKLGRQPVRSMDSSTQDKDESPANSRRGMGLFLAVGLIERAGGLMQFSQVSEKAQDDDTRELGARVFFSMPLFEVAQ